MFDAVVIGEAENQFAGIQGEYDGEYSGVL